MSQVHVHLISSMFGEGTLTLGMSTGLEVWSWEEDLVPGPPETPGITVSGLWYGFPGCLSLIGLFTGVPRATALLRDRVQSACGVRPGLWVAQGGQAGRGLCRC